MSLCVPCVSYPSRSGRAVHSSHPLAQPSREQLRSPLVCIHLSAPRPRSADARAAFDLGVIQSPRAWLEARLGPLAGFDLAEARAAHCGLSVLDALFDAAAVVPESSGWIKPRLPEPKHSTCCEWAC